MLQQQAKMELYSVLVLGLKAKIKLRSEPR
jgi:hypothetical protein